MRASYITWFYNQPGGATFNDKQQLSRMMRNSVLTQQKNYYKIELEKAKHLSDTEDEEEDYKSDCEDVKIELTRKMDELKNISEQNAKEKSQKYAESLKNKRRSDIIRRANKGLTKSIKESTLKEYNIMYDENKKTYY